MMNNANKKWLFLGLDAFQEFFKKLYGFLVNFLIRQFFFGLIKKQKCKIFINVVNKYMLIEAVTFAQNPFKIIAVDCFFKMFFGNGNPDF